MSSVQRFIRQLPAQSYFNAATVAASPSTLVYEFVPSSANVVGNYPPGNMQLASAALQAAIAQAVNAAGAAANLQLRDMGKTLFAPVNGGNFGFFRQVQLIAPQAISAAQGFIGGPAGSTFGVLGAAGTPDAYTDFLTFYVPVSVAGVNYGPVNTALYNLAGGQM
jgi:hypothetical protein